MLELVVLRQVVGLIQGSDGGRWLDAPYEETTQSRAWPPHPSQVQGLLKAAQRVALELEAAHDGRGHLVAETVPRTVEAARFWLRDMIVTEVANAVAHLAVCGRRVVIAKALEPQTVGAVRGALVSAAVWAALECQVDDLAPLVEGWAWRARLGVYERVAGQAEELRERIEAEQAGGAS